MADENLENRGELGRTPLEDRVSADKRQFLKLVLGSMTAYSVPLMASFSMGGLRFGAAQAGGILPQYRPLGQIIAKEITTDTTTNPGGQTRPVPIFVSNQATSGEGSFGTDTLPGYKGDLP